MQQRCCSSDLQEIAAEKDYYGLDFRTVNLGLRCHLNFSH